MKLSKKFFPLAMLALCVGNVSEAYSETTILQQSAKQAKSSISGMVTDADGAPLSGVSIYVSSLKSGTITDMNGRYQLALPADGTYDVDFSLVGMETVSRKIKVKGSMNLATVIMNDNVAELGEVVVTGYGNIQKGSYTGAASVMSIDKQKELPVISISQMMEGNLSGVSISTGSGTPGASSSLNIRGIGSLNASSEPLFVLDGVPVMSGNMSSNDMNSSGFGILSTLNPADIENITVLKDAASASLYGARGANGVVLITTKKGKEGKTTFNVKAGFGISDLAYNFRPTMGGDERRALILEGLTNANINAGQSVEWAEENAEAVINRYAPIPANGYADWENALFRTALQQNYDFSMMGGTQNTKYAASLNYTNQQNVARNSGFDRYSGHLSVTNKYKNFDVAMNTMFSLTSEKPLPGSTYYSNPMCALKSVLHPSIPIYNSDGSYNTDIQTLSNMNLVYENEVNFHKNRIARTFGSIEAGYTFIPGLRLSTLFNVDYTYTKEKRYFAPSSSDGAAINGQGEYFGNENLTFNSNTRLNYVKKFGDHSVDVLAAYEIHKWNKEYIYARAEDYAVNGKPSLGVASTPAEIGNYEDNDAMLSFVARANYDYKNKYYFSGSFRRDGSSRLHPDKRWSNFWALSGSWRLSEEAFMSGTKSWLNDAKVRASYGVNGNIPGGLYSYYGLYNATYIYNDSPAMVESSLANKNLSWEKNYALNIGIDFTLFSRVNVSFDWYTRDTRDLLMSKTVDPITGFGSITDNIGKIRNTGFELEIRSTNIKTKNFTWNTTLLMTHNKNKIIKLSDVPQYTTGSYYVVKEGYSLGMVYLREYAGVDPQTGLPQYVSNIEDENGVRSKEIVNDPNNSVSVPLKCVYPVLTGGLTNTFRYKDIDLSFNLTYSLGGYSYDSAMWALQDDGYSSTAPKSVELRRRWQKPGDITDVPRYVAGQEFGGWWHSSRGIHSTDHLRLKSVILGYNLPSKWMKRIGMNSVRVYFSGSNLLTWAAYNQYDPEINGTVEFEIPPLKTYSFGLEVGF